MGFQEGFPTRYAYQQPMRSSSASEQGGDGNQAEVRAESHLGGLGSCADLRCQNIHRYVNACQYRYLGRQGQAFHQLTMFTIYLKGLGETAYSHI